LLIVQKNTDYVVQMIFLYLFKLLFVMHTDCFYLYMDDDKTLWHFYYIVQSTVMFSVVLTFNTHPLQYQKMMAVTVK